MGVYLLLFRGIKFTMVQHIDQSNDSDSLEKRAQIKHEKGPSRRGILKALGLGAGALAMQACMNAPGFFDILKEDVKGHRGVMTSQYGGILPEDSAKEVLDFKEEVKLYKPSEKVVEDLNIAVDAKINDLGATEKQNLSNVYDELKRQNKALNNLFESGKIKQYVLFNAKRNIYVDGLEQQGEVSLADIDKMQEAFKELNASLKQVGYQSRQKLKDELKDDKEFQELITYNRKQLDILNRMCIRVADLATIEGRLKEVVDAQAISTNIQRSTTIAHLGDIYAGAQGEGKKSLDRILQKTVSEVARPQSKFAQVYSNPDMKLGDAYAELKKKIWTEGTSWNSSSLNNVTNKYLATALNMAKEAYERGGILSKPQFQAVVRTITRDAFNTIRDGMFKAQGISVGWDILVPAIPGYSVVAAIANAREAFTTDNAEAKSLSDALLYGNRIKNGYQSRHNFAGSTAPAIVRFSSAAISTGLQIGAGLYFLSAARDSKSSSGGGSSGTPPVLGGEIGGPGTGPR